MSLYYESFHFSIVKKWYSNNVNNTKLHVVKGHKAKLLGASLTEQASRDMLSYPELEQLGFIVCILILAAVSRSCPCASISNASSVC
jgi:hypothetical protein